MMQVIRDKAQGIIAWVIVGIIAFVLCFWGISGFLAQGGSDVVAKVGGRKITADEINDIYNRWLRANAMQKDFDPTGIDPNRIKQEITQAIARQAALINSMDKSGLAISDAMVVDNIKRNPQLQENGEFSMRLYKDALASMNLDEGAFEDMQREELMINQLQLAILSSGFVVKSEVERFIELKNQKRDFGYAIIPAGKFMASVTVSDQAIADFYAKHKEQFTTPEQLQLEYIELSMDDLLKQISVSDQKLRDYYQANLADFTQPAMYHLRHIAITAPKDSAADKSGEAQEKIEDIYRKLQAGANFQTLAKTDSDDKLTGADGGDIGWVRKDDPTIPVVAYTLTKTGEYTKPVRSDYGWHVFQLAEFKPGSVQSFASVKDVLADRYKHDETLRVFSSKGEELANLTFENPTSLTAASEKLNLPIQTTEFFSRQGGAGIVKSPNVLRAAFSEDVYNAMHNSELIRLSDDSYVVIRVKDKQAAKELSLDQVRGEITKHLQLIGANDKAKQLGQDLLNEIQRGNSPNKSLSAKGLVWRVVSNVERDNKTVDPIILQRAFSIARPAADQKVSAVGFNMSNGDYALVALNNVTSGVVDKSEDSNLIDSFAKQLSLLTGRYEFASLQDALIEQTRIKYLGK